MILGGLIKMLVALVAGALSLFPSWEMPKGPGFSALAAANIVLPLDVWATLMGLTLAVMAAGMTFWAVKFALNLVRGSGA